VLRIKGEVLTEVYLERAGEEIRLMVDKGGNKSCLLTLKNGKVSLDEIGPEFGFQRDLFGQVIVIREEGEDPDDDFDDTDWDDEDDECDADCACHDLEDDDEDPDDTDEYQERQALHNI
jgi:hypothetical protein